jgi:hypothetical protein
MPDKLKLAGRERPAVINAPEGFEIKGASKLAGKFDWIMLFVKNEAELAKSIGKAVAALEPEGLLWIAFPKAVEDPDRPDPRQRVGLVEKHSLMWVTLVSVNEAWSAFGVRPLRKGESANWR